MQPAEIDISRIYAKILQHFVRGFILDNDCDFIEQRTYVARQRCDDLFKKRVEFISVGLSHNLNGRQRALEICP